MYSNLKIFAVLMVAFVALAGSVVVEFKDCGSNLGKLTLMDFDCDGRRWHTRSNIDHRPTQVNALTVV